MNREAIDFLRYIRDSHEDNACAQISIAMAIDALEKQIPNKPQNKEPSDSTNVFFTGECPSCGILISQCCSDTYCMWCGQKLDWGEGE